MEHINTSLRIVSTADTAIVVEFGDTIDREVNDRVLAANEIIRRADLTGVVETVPTFRSVMIHYDPMATSAKELTTALENLLQTDGTRHTTSRNWLIPVCYAEAMAPDLEDVARRTGLTPDEVIDYHCSRTYHVYMIGFLPGYPYMGDLPDEIRLPRRESPRIRLPAGSVGIATSMTAIYPYESPGGWHLIGATPVPIFEPTETPPARLAAGDSVGFQSIGLSTYEQISGDVAAGVYSLAPLETAT